MRAATINGAEYLGMDDDLGSISAGKLADLIVLDENPIEKIENTDSMDQVWPEKVERGRFFFQ